MSGAVDFTGFIRSFQDKKVLVIGDMMLDQFIWGRVNRISPEAPVPVVQVIYDSFHLGGAGNVINNIKALGGLPIPVGVIGEDDAAFKMKEAFAEKRIDMSGLVIDPTRSTILKTRIIAQNQQVVRTDREDTTAIDETCRTDITARCLEAMEGAEAVVISDYNKGVISDRLMRDILAKAADLGRMVIVDPKIEHVALYQGVTMITPNQYEAESMAGIRITDERSLRSTGEALLERLNATAVLITLGAQGMTLFQEDGSVIPIPSTAKEVYDVTGAGDTVISTMTLALIGGATWEEAAVMANDAAGIVVGKVGTAVVTAEELNDRFRRT
jgi:D-beta-D-heptose 7-phosphate kinase/D-beta-D-heptose 1-phosphate adenosyltransferase